MKSKEGKKGGKRKLSKEERRELETLSYYYVIKVLRVSLHIWMQNHFCVIKIIIGLQGRDCSAFKVGLLDLRPGL